MIDVEGIQAASWAINGGLMVAVRWLWKRLDKCEARHDEIDRKKQEMQNRPKRARKLK